MVNFLAVAHRQSDIKAEHSIPAFQPDRQFIHFYNFLDSFFRDGANVWGEIKSFTILHNEAFN
jgi:hypothetical protein